MRSFLVVGVLIAACRGRDDTPSAQPVQAPPPAHNPADDFRLPRTSIDVKKMLWRTRKEVEAVLGRAGASRPDHRWAYDLGKDGALLDTLLVRYEEKGHAVSFEVPAAAAGFDRYSDPQKDFIGRWFGVGPPNEPTEINGRKYDYGDGFDGVGLGLYDHEFNEAMNQRARDAAEHDTEQQEIVKGLNILFKSSGSTAVAVAFARGDDLVLTPAPGDRSCDKETLRLLRKSLAEFKLDPAKAFATMQCDGGAVLKLR